MPTRTRQPFADLSTRAERSVILAAEAHTKTRRLIGEALRDGYQVVFCSDGAEARKKAHLDRPDLVVIDLAIPGADRLIASMRGRAPWVQAPVLVLCAKAGRAVQAKLLGRPLQDYLLKPFPAEELRARVRNLIWIARARDLLQKELGSRHEDLADLAQRAVTRMQSLERRLEARRASEEHWRAIFETSAVGIAVTNLEGRFLAANRAYQEMVGYSDEELRTLSYLDLTHEDDRAENQVLAKNLHEGKYPQFTMQKRYRRKDGRLIWVKNTVSQTPGTETVPAFGMSIVEDITERKQAEEKLKEYARVVESLQEMILVDREPRFSIPNPAFLLDRGLDQESDTGQPVAEFLDKEVFEKVVKDRAASILQDIAENQRPEEELQRSFYQLRSLIAQLQRVREEERTMVAREIHDELGQALTALKLDVTALIRELRSEQVTAVQRGQSILKLLDETMQSVQRVSTDLRPGILDDLGLTAGLEWAAGELEARTGTKCRIRMPREQITVDAERATALFRIFQETLTNVARHAQATEVDVRVATDQANLILTVHDNGQGIRPEQVAAGKSLGILGMRERARMLGGELLIQGAPGRGTTVTVRIPRAKPQAEGMAR